MQTQHLWCLGRRSIPCAELCMAPWLMTDCSDLIVIVNSCTGLWLIDVFHHLPLDKPNSTLPDPSTADCASTRSPPGRWTKNNRSVFRLFHHHQPSPTCPGTWVVHYPIRVSTSSCTSLAIVSPLRPSYCMTWSAPPLVQLFNARRAIVCIRTSILIVSLETTVVEVEET